jgi:hypothetical protein
MSALEFAGATPSLCNQRDLGRDPTFSSAAGHHSFLATVAGACAPVVDAGPAAVAARAGRGRGCCDQSPKVYSQGVWSQPGYSRSVAGHRRAVCFCVGVVSAGPAICLAARVREAASAALSARMLLGLDDRLVDHYPIQRDGADHAGRVRAGVSVPAVAVGVHVVHGSTRTDDWHGVPRSLVLPLAGLGRFVHTVWQRP